MKRALTPHLLSMLLVTVILLVTGWSFQQARNSARAGAAIPDPVTGDISFVNFSDPLHAALLADVLDIYYPGRHEANRRALDSLRTVREQAFRRTLSSAHVETALDGTTARTVFFMYFKFLLLYGCIMVLTLYGVQTIAVLRFCRHKAATTSQRPVTPGSLLRTLAGRVVSQISIFILFSPAYVIAYSLRTGLNTDTVFFMVLLCVISNGVLILYANRFFTLLNAESRRGYVETALAKNLHAAYGRHEPHGISLRAILRPVKRFDGHVFGQIFANAQLQYLATFKEQASFVITGMIITEMALNIHGQLNYTLLRHILYGNWDIVLLIIGLIFYTVKTTDMLTDLMILRSNIRLGRGAA